MYITAFFTDNGVPKTSLTPTIRIRDLSDNSLVVTDASMSEVGDGYYKYNFSSYDDTKDYAIRCDGGESLDNAERYTYGTNITGGLAEDATLDLVKLETDKIQDIKDQTDLIPTDPATETTLALKPSLADIESSTILAKEASLNDIATKIEAIRKMEYGRWRLINNQIIYYADDNVTEIARFNVFDINGTATMTNIAERRKV